MFNQGMIMNHQRIVPVLLRGLALGVLTLAAFEPAAAQTPTTLQIDQQRSLVWWQIDPHFGHLWASSCPKDPSWQPGEGHSAGYYLNYAARPNIGTTKASENKIPLFPRRTVRPNCRTAVSGTFTSTDPVAFTNFRGKITVLPDSIETGANHRDAFATKYVYNTDKYPTIDFVIDSLTNIAVSASGDTVNAVAVGTFHLRGAKKATRVQVRGIKEPSGLRVRGVFAMPASELRDQYGVSQWAMGAGIGLKLWDTLFMGFDLILTPPGANQGGT
jgi:hypothetical protein